MLNVDLLTEVIELMAKLDNNIQINSE
jgi:hypothetical protein